jgi:hypothetical protein
VGTGAYSEDRCGRGSGMTCISIVDRGTLKVIAEIEVGPFGNSCALLLVSDRDRSDRSSGFLETLLGPWQRRRAS